MNNACKTVYTREIAHGAHEQILVLHREFTLTERIKEKAFLEELSKREQAGEENLAIRR